MKNKDEIDSRFDRHLTLHMQLRRLEDELIAEAADPEFRLYALVIEAVHVARRCQDEEAYRELETAARRVLDRHALPSVVNVVVEDDRPPEQFHNAPARQIRLPEAVRLLHSVLEQSAAIADDAAHDVARTREEIMSKVVPRALGILRGYAEHWAGRGCDADALGEVLTSAVLDVPSKNVVREVLRAWGASALIIGNALKVVKRPAKTIGTQRAVVTTARRQKS